MFHYFAWRESLAITQQERLKAIDEIEAEPAKPADAAASEEKTSAAEDPDDADKPASDDADKPAPDDAEKPAQDEETSTDKKEDAEAPAKTTEDIDSNEKATENEIGGENPDVVESEGTNRGVVTNADGVTGQEQSMSSFDDIANWVELEAKYRRVREFFAQEFPDIAALCPEPSLKPEVHKLYVKFGTEIYTKASKENADKVESGTGISKEDLLRLKPTKPKLTRKKKTKKSKKKRAYERQLSFEDRMKQLEHFVKGFGHARVAPSHDKGLAHWVRRIRDNYRDCQLTPDLLEKAPITPFQLTPERIERLTALQFEWKLRHIKVVDWEDYYNQLVEYKNEHGHPNVPRFWKENFHLAEWVRRQRRDYRLKRRLWKNNRYERLVELGFNFEPPNNKNPSFDDRLEECKDFRRRTGHLTIPDAGDDAVNITPDERSFRQWYVTAVFVL